MSNFAKPLFMKSCFLFFFLISTNIFSQVNQSDNIVIVTIDGFRWQELFEGADSALLFNTQIVKDTSTARDLYWAETMEERRKKLMPFSWNVLAKKGQLWGNRKYNNKVSVRNPYRFSYAGYNEMLTGYVDPGIVTNKRKVNNNQSVLSHLESLPAFQHKVAAFCSWNLFPFIFREQKENFLINAGYQERMADTLTDAEVAVNNIQQITADQHLPTRSDLLTFTLATEYMRTKHPRVLFIGFGETDEFAHHAAYDKYLSQANMIDKFLAEIWALIQGDDFYKNKTTLFITTDHGRGRKVAKWSKHGPFIGGSSETWLMQIGKNIMGTGEVKEKLTVFNDEFAQTIAAYLGERFTASHPVKNASQHLTVLTRIN